MQGTAHPRVIKRLFRIVEPHGLNHALVKGGAGHPRRCLDLLGRDRVEDTGIMKEDVLHFAFWMPDRRVLEKTSVKDRPDDPGG